MRKVKEIESGAVFGRLTVISPNGSIRNYRAYLCRCACGNEVTVISASLRSGNTKSCGCLGLETKQTNKIKHGESHKTRLYSCWSDMRNRCNCTNRKAYKYYGGRGIKVCKEWDDYNTFKIWATNNGYADNLTLDRINPDGNYKPANCRWITIQEQQRNRRKRQSA